jgi:hypothetical protein
MAGTLHIGPLPYLAYLPPREVKYLFYRYIEVKRSTPAFQIQYKHPIKQPLCENDDYIFSFHDVESCAILEMDDSRVFGFETVRRAARLG